MLEYKRGRFELRLSEDRFYTAAHYWLREVDPSVWRVGFTAFAAKMLGDPVEHQFEVEPGSHVECGQKLGWIEGLKALNEIYAAAQGVFGEANPELIRDITLLERDPYEAGWLYQVTGRPDPNAMDVHGYARILDSTIDKLQANCPDGEGCG
jgi:glycine cleavage system H protein